MKVRSRVSLGLFALLGALTISFAPAFADVGAQGHETPPGRGCHCAAETSSCLFGEAGGCSVECRAGFLCKCKGATCPFGFPSAASCQCINVGA